jgi:hypothetical protein
MEKLCKKYDHYFEKVQKKFLYKVHNFMKFKSTSFIFLLKNYLIFTFLNIGILNFVISNLYYYKLFHF